MRKKQRERKSEQIAKIGLESSHLIVIPFGPFERSQLNQTLPPIPSLLTSVMRCIKFNQRNAPRFYCCCFSVKFWQVFSKSYHLLLLLYITYAVVHTHTERAV